MLFVDQDSGPAVEYQQVAPLFCATIANGWYYSDTSETDGDGWEVTLCGTACDEFKLNNGANFEYFCQGG